MKSSFAKSSQLFPFSIDELKCNFGSMELSQVLWLRATPINPKFTHCFWKLVNCAKWKLSKSKGFWSKLQELNKILKGLLKVLCNLAVITSPKKVFLLCSSFLNCFINVAPKLSFSPTPFKRRSGSITLGFFCFEGCQPKRPWRESQFHLSLKPQS